MMNPKVQDNSDDVLEKSDTVAKKTGIIFH